MKLIAVLILYFVTCSAYYDHCTGPSYWGVLLRCMADNGASYDDLSGLLFNHPAKSEKAKCFRACLYLTCNYMAPDGRFYADAPKRLALLLNSGIASVTQAIEQSAKYCVHNTRRYKSLCDTAEAYTQCIINTSPVRLAVHGVF